MLGIMWITLLITIKIAVFAVDNYVGAKNFVVVEKSRCRISVVYGEANTSNKAFDEGLIGAPM